MLILPVVFSIFSCSLVSAELQKTSPSANISNNPSPSPEAVVTKPEASPSFVITPGNGSQIDPSNQATLESTNRVVSPYDSSIQGRLIADPYTFAQKLKLLSKKICERPI